MKKLIAFIVLFCLVFLNVPRELTHHCDHDFKNHKQSKNSSQQNSFDADDCFACEFDLDSGHVHNFQFSISTEIINTVLAETHEIQYHRGQLGAFLLRGPPIV